MKERIQMLDIVRGIAMFFIVGGDVIALMCCRAFPHPITDAIAKQLGHAHWEGFRFYDLLFPTFLLISGASFTFAWRSQSAKGLSSLQRWRKLAVRTLLLIGLGILYNGALACGTVADIRFPSVLARIGLGVFLAAIPYTCLKPTLRPLFFPVGLLGYALLFSYCGGYAEANTWAGRIDALLIPNATGLDPEGIISTVGALLTAYLGMLLGDFLHSPIKGKSLGMAVAGGLLIGVAYAAAPWCPVIKKLWTSSYVCMAGGWTLLLCATVFWLADTLHLYRWFKPLAFIGIHALTFYLLAKFVNFYAIVWQFIALPLNLSGTPAPIQSCIHAVAAFALLTITVTLLRRKS